MQIFILRFGSPRKGEDPDGDLVWDYAACLWKNGQIGRDYLVQVSQPPFAAVVKAWAASALSPRRASPWGREALEKVRRAYGRLPRLTPLQKVREERLPSWRLARTFYLSTDLLARDSPVGSPEMAVPVPLFLLPLAPGL